MYIGRIPHLYLYIVHNLLSGNTSSLLLHWCPRRGHLSWLAGDVGSRWGKWMSKRCHHRNDNKDWKVFSFLKILLLTVCTLLDELAILSACAWLDEFPGKLCRGWGAWGIFPISKKLYRWKSLWYIYFQVVDFIKQHGLKGPEGKYPKEGQYTQVCRGCTTFAFSFSTKKMLSRLEHHQCANQCVLRNDFSV